MKAAFLDRDGVINREVNYLHNIVDFKYVPKTKQALRNLKELVSIKAAILLNYLLFRDSMRVSQLKKL